MHEIGWAMSRNIGLLYSSSTISPKDAKIVKNSHSYDFYNLATSIGTSYLPQLKKRAVTNLKNYSTKNDKKM